ncbi:hypothetical protein ABIE65_001816 [Constrictibacter sp. MBR-5]|jgi:hypothetical protein|uniref:exopolysaccharide biosynthesis protein n=1 Tax=Constrictibacter sp. MBR-5 TaxID=3156467 RepID=UPI00339939E3
MPEERTRALSEVLEHLERSVHGRSITVQDMMDALGRKSFAAMIMIFALLAASPASAVPGLTATVGLAVAVMVVQMLAGRDCIWLPGFLAGRRIPSQRVCQAIGWLRRPVHAVERVLRPRMTFLIKRPWLYLPLSLMLCIALFMPFMEVVPTSGSIAATVVALFAAGMLMRDGALVFAATLLSAAVPGAVWWFGFA